MSDVFLLIDLVIFSGYVIMYFLILGFLNLSFLQFFNFGKFCCCLLVFRLYMELSFVVCFMECAFLFKNNRYVFLPRSI